MTVVDKSVTQNETTFNCITLHQIKDEYLDKEMVASGRVIYNDKIHCKTLNCSGASEDTNFAAKNLFVFEPS
jgi:hypothetical protein